MRPCGSERHRPLPAQGATSTSSSSGHITSSSSGYRTSSSGEHSTRSSIGHSPRTAALPYRHTCLAVRDALAGYRGLLCPASEDLSKSARLVDHAVISPADDCWISPPCIRARAQRMFIASPCLDPSPMNVPCTFLAGCGPRECQYVL